MKRADVLVLGGAIVAASGALVLLDTAVTSVPEPILARSTVLPESIFALPPVPGIATGFFETEGKQVPLPPGKWVEMRRTVSPYGPATGATHAPVVSTVLFRLQGHRIDAAVLVQVNPPEATSNWGIASGCERRDFYFTDIRYVSDHDSACSYVTYVTPWATSAPAIDDAWRLSMQQAVDNGWDVPQQWLAVVYRMTDPLDAMQVRYLFDPSLGKSGGKEVTSDEVARLTTWSELSWRAVQTGFFGHLKPGSADTLGEWATTRAQPLALWDRTARPAPDRAAMKTTSEQIIGSLSSFAVTYLYLGSLAAASTLSVAASVVTGAMSYANDMVWSHVPDPAVRLPDLPGAGLEQSGPTIL